MNNNNIYSQFEQNIDQSINTKENTKKNTKENIKENIKENTINKIDQFDVNRDKPTNIINKTKNINRCYFCNKKLKLIYYNCDCNNKFCEKHRYKHIHNCNNVDKYKKILEMNNPKISPSKLNKII